MQRSCGAAAVGAGVRCGGAAKGCGLTKRCQQSNLSWFMWIYFLHKNRIIWWVYVCVLVVSADMYAYDYTTPSTDTHSHALLLTVPYVWQHKRSGGAGEQAAHTQRHMRLFTCTYFISTTHFNNSITKNSLSFSLATQCTTVRVCGCVLGSIMCCS